MVLDDGTLSATIGVDFQGGSLEGNGIVEGALNIGSGAIIAPGFSAGLIEVEGSFDFGGIFELELGGLADNLFDRILADGAITLADGSTIELHFIDGFLPELGNTFDILVGDTILDEGLMLDQTFLPAGFMFDFSIAEVNSQALRLEVVDVPGGQQSPPTGVPEPGTVTLFGAGLAGITWMRRRLRELGRPL